MRLLVSVVVLALALITLGNKGLFDKYFSRKLFSRGALVIAVVLLLRAIGDFRFVGFFKTVKDTRFAVNDTYIFSPLCLILAILSLYIFLLGKDSERSKI
jgi:hypothetical protein